MSLAVKNEKSGTIPVKNTKSKAESHRFLDVEHVRRAAKTNYKPTREEMETVIRGNSGNPNWEIVTADPRIIRRMGKQGYKPDDKPNPWGYVSFTVPADRVRIGKAEKTKRGFAAKKPVELHNNVVFGSQNSSGMVG